MEQESTTTSDERAAKRSDLLAVALTFLSIGMPTLMGPEWGWPFLITGLGAVIVYLVMWRANKYAWLNNALIALAILFVLASAAVIAYKFRTIPKLNFKAATPSVPSSQELVAEYLRALATHHQHLRPATADNHASSISSRSGTAVGTVNIQPGGVASFGQQGGITANTVNITPDAPMPELTNFQKTTIGQSLRDAGAHAIAVRFTQGNERSQYVADQFKKLMTDSGWMLRRPKFLIEESIARGIFILIDQDEVSMLPESAVLLRDALSKGGLPPTIVAVEGLGKGNVDLAVGVQ